MIFKNSSQLITNLEAGSIVEIDNKLKEYQKTSIVTAVRTRSLILRHLVVGEELERAKKCHAIHLDKLSDDYWLTTFLGLQRARDMRFRKDGSIDFLAYKEKNNIVPGDEFKVGDVWLTIKFHGKGNEKWTKKLLNIKAGNT